MTQQNPVFDISEYELRGYINPYLSPEQTTAVIETTTRVNGQLDFLAQMLGWNGPNYWTNLPATVDQKRQLLGGTFGVYNSYVIPRIYEIRNWSNEIVVDRLQFLSPGRQTVVVRILLGDNVYQLRSVKQVDDKYIINIGELDQEFFDLIAAGEPLRADIPTYRPAPFNRSSIGVAGDSAFVCGNSGDNLTLYPSYDTQKKFPLKFPALFAGSTYYFDQPIYLALDSTLTPEVSPIYDPVRELWFLQVPDSLADEVGLTPFLAWANSSSTRSDNFSLEVVIQAWRDPSDWNSIDVLDNFRGAWGNKGGALPFNFVFDSLSLHGFNEKNSVYLPPVIRSISFNDVINYIYYQKTVVSDLAPAGAQAGDIWWNEGTGALAIWLPSLDNCGAWVEIDYRNAPTQVPPPSRNYSDVASFRADLANISPNEIVRIDDVTGLAISDGVIGVQGTLTSPGSLTLHRSVGSSFWEADKFSYLTVSAFERDAILLPFQVPVTIINASGLSNSNYGSYTVNNLSITISGDYEVLLLKYYTNTTWELYPDSLLKYIALTSLFESPLQGEMWWDYVNPDPDTRSAAVFYSPPSPISTIRVKDPGVGLIDGFYTGVGLAALTGEGGLAVVDITVFGGQVIGISITNPGTNPGDMYQLEDLVGPDPLTYPGLVGAVFEVTSTTAQNWVAVNYHNQNGAPSASLDLGTVLIYCDGFLLTPGSAYTTNDYVLLYTEDPVDGVFNFEYTSKTFEGAAQLPTIIISDAITTAYRADITQLVFGGVAYYMSPNVYDAETPLRIWKAQDLQVVENLDHLAEDNYINPLLADLNNGPGPENWEKYFIRLPLDYGRNGAEWQKSALICQDFAYWGSSIDPEKMRCPPGPLVPAIYEELFLYDQPIPDYTYVYSEPYLYSNVAYYNSVESDRFQNSGVYPATDVQFDEFTEGALVEYDPLHERRADVTSPWGEGFGNWEGEYVNVNPCITMSGFFATDLLNEAIEPVIAPVWDASIYRFAPTCESAPETYSVDANHYKIGYAYFAADASAAEDAFFDLSQEAAWRFPAEQPRSLYLTPR